MCIACEMGFWGMVEAMSPQAREQYLREQAERFACDAPPQAEPQTELQPEEPRNRE
jgi:hypothetical protein